MHTVVLVPHLPHPLGPRLQETLKARLGCIPVLAPFDQAEEVLGSNPVDMLVLVLSPAPDAALEVIRKLRSRVFGPVLAVGQASESKLILRALHEGADHYLDEADLEMQLEAVLLRLHGREGSRERQRPEPAGRLVCVLGASGGCGTSTLAVNLATVLARQHGRCALIDLKPGVGDLAALLDLRPEHSLADLCLNSGRMDRAMFEAALVPHTGGVHLLAPPQMYEDIRLVTPKGVHKTLTLARETFPLTVADLEDCFHEEQVIALRQADLVLLVFRLDFTALRNTRRILDYFEQIGIPAERVRLVINRYGQAKELPVSEAEEALGRKVAYFIPDDPKTINGANNTGVPVVLKTPSSKVAQSIAHLAGELARRGSEGNIPPSLARRANSPARSAGWLASFF
jgi:pilus assembly protein CpaE